MLSQGDVARKVLWRGSACLGDVLKFLNRDTYMDIAMYASSFCTGAQHAKAVLSDEATSVVSIHGATWFFRFTGLISISAAGGLATFLMATMWPTLSNPESTSFVYDPLFLAGFSAVINFLVAIPFMQVFICSADAILYCIAVERRWHREQLWKAEGAASTASGLLSSLTCSMSSRDARSASYPVPNHSPETLALLYQVAQ